MEYLAFLLVVVAGAVTVLKLRLHDPRFVRLFNAFTGTYLLCLTFLHIVPELYTHGAEAGHEINALRIGVFVLIGFFAQVLLEGLSLGAEHGHSSDSIADSHESGHGHNPHATSFRVGVVVGLCLHALVEATAVGEKHHHFDETARSLLFLSILIHKYPVTIAFLGTLLQTGMSRLRALSWLALFAAMAPLGLLIGGHTPLANYSRELTALVVGIFMHVATTVLFESTDSHQFNRGKFVAILIGLIAGGLTVLFH
jgi:zinc transporter ZupT